MITGIRNLNKEFFKQFHKMQIPMSDGSKLELSARYYKQSSYDYTENTDQRYPCVSIQDFAPTIRTGWYVDHREVFLGLSPDKKVGYLGKNPVWLEARFDVSIASKGYKEFLDIADYFDKKFVYASGFVFNATDIEGSLVGDVVTYSTRVTDIARADGVMERNYEFTLNPWVYFQEPSEVDLIENIIIKGSPVGQK